MVYFISLKMPVIGVICLHDYPPMNRSQMGSIGFIGKPLWWRVEFKTTLQLSSVSVEGHSRRTAISAKPIAAIAFSIRSGNN